MPKVYSKKVFYTLNVALNSTLSIIITLNFMLSDSVCIFDDIHLIPIMGIHFYEPLPRLFSKLPHLLCLYSNFNQSEIFLGLYIFNELPLIAKPRCVPLACQSYESNTYLYPSLTNNHYTHTISYISSL